MAGDWPNAPRVEIAGGMGEAGIEGAGVDARGAEAGSRCDDAPGEGTVAEDAAMGGAVLESPLLEGAVLKGAAGAARSDRAEGSPRRTPAPCVPAPPNP